jgi:hypothetical protein
MNIIGGRIDGTYDYDDGVTHIHRKLTDEEIKELFNNIRLNTQFALPERLVQDFIQDGSIKPTFKKCIHFNKEDLHDMIQRLKQKPKNQKRKIPKKKTRKKSENKKNKKIQE